MVVILVFAETIWVLKGSQGRPTALLLASSVPMNSAGQMEEEHRSLPCLGRIVCPFTLDATDYGHLPIG